MLNSPSVFSMEKIALTAAAASVLSMVVLLILRRFSAAISVEELILLGLVVGLSVFGWRIVGNVAQLNDDPVPPFSPNDVLCPVVTYVLLGIFAAFHPPKDVTGWKKTRAWLTVVSLFVNVLFI